MSELKQQIVQQLPYLRRYARALTGSQQTGDQHIRLCLEALLEAPERLKGRGSLPVRLFRLFHQTVSSAGSAKTLPRSACASRCTGRPSSRSHR